LGCTNEDAVKAFKIYGLQAEIKQNCTLAQLKTHIKKGIPPIVDWFTGGVAPSPGTAPNGHYSIVVDVDDKHVHLMDPEDGEIRKLYIEDFMRVWFDWSKDKILTKNSKMFYQTMIVAYKKLS
jgi:predicted double-glycine peptidase